MNPLVKLGAFAVLLVVVFAGGLALGAAVGPFDDGGNPPAHMEHSR